MTTVPGDDLAIFEEVPPAKRSRQTVSAPSLRPRQLPARLVDPHDRAVGARYLRPPRPRARRCCVADRGGRRESRDRRGDPPEPRPRSAAVPAGGRARLTSALQGDLGPSLITNEPVTTLVWRALPPTLSLLLVSAVLALVFAVVAAPAQLDPARWHRRTTSSSRRRRSGSPIPSFWLAIILANYFAVKKGSFPGDRLYGACDRLLALAAPRDLARLRARRRQLRRDRPPAPRWLARRAQAGLHLSARMRGFIEPHSPPPSTPSRTPPFRRHHLGVRLAQLLGGTVGSSTSSGSTGSHPPRQRGDVAPTSRSCSSESSPMFAVIVTIINFFVDLLLRVLRPPPAVRRR